MAKIVREGIGGGALKQYHLLRGRIENDGPPSTKLYFNAFTRDEAALSQAKAKGYKIVSRVGGWHFDSAETTGWVLSQSDGVIFVSEYTRQLAHKWFGDKVPERQAVIPNSTEMASMQPLHDPPYLLVRCGGMNWPVWKKWMLSRGLSIFCLHAIWPDLRERYPGLQLHVLGRTNHRIKERVPPRDGIRYVEYIDDTNKLRKYGSGAVALVHLVIGDHSPNTVAEIIGEGRPAIVLDKGGTRETAGCAGLVVPTVLSDEKTRVDTWWPLDERTYRPDLGALFRQVCQALDHPGVWRDGARKRAGQMTPDIVAGKYLEFMGSL